MMSCAHPATSELMPMCLRAQLGCYALAIFCVFGAAGLARADAGPGDRSRAAPFTQYIPASWKVFVAVRKAGEVDRALQRAHAWRLPQLLTGSPADDTGAPDLRQIVGNILGLRSPDSLDEFVKSEIAVGAPSWSQLGAAVWLARISDDKALDRVFPRKDRTGEGMTRGVRFFRTRDRVIVCVHEGVVAVSRRWGPQSPLDKVVDLMAGRGGRVLERFPAFRSLVKYLPAGDLAVAYIVRDDTVPGEALSSLPSWPDAERAVIALYEGDGRIDVAIRAALAKPQRIPRLEQAAVEQFLRLPQTTLFASVTTINLDYAYKAAANSPATGTMGRYLAFLAAIAGASDVESRPRPRLGPHVIFAWGQDLRVGRSTPQVAILIGCPEGGAVREHVRGIVDKLTRLVRAVDPASVTDVLTIQEEKHLGVPILHVPIGTYAEKSRLPFATLLRNVDPAWAVANGWLILTLSRDHMERILEAHFGLVPTLETVPDVQIVRKRRVARSALSIVQAELATDVLDRWVAAFESGSGSLLDPVWWQGVPAFAAPEPPRLGIGMTVAQEAGVVAVARVYPDTAADGRLQPGDRILGIDGLLLPLTAPNAALRKLWAKSVADPGPTLRVQRDGVAIDVVLPRRKRHGARPSPVRIQPADAVRELSSLGRAMPFASFTVHVSDERSYSARLTLRFAPERASGSTAPK